MRELKAEIGFDYIIFFDDLEISLPLSLPNTSIVFQAENCDINVTAKKICLFSFVLRLTKPLLLCLWPIKLWIWYIGKLQPDSLKSNLIEYKECFALKGVENEFRSLDSRIFCLSIRRLSLQFTV